MPNLRYLVVDDGPFTVDYQRLEDRYLELSELYNSYGDLQFECNIVS